MAEPLSQDSGISGITYLRKGKMPHNSEEWGKTTLEIPKWEQEEREYVFWAPEQSPAAPGDTTPEQISTLQLLKEPMLEQVYPEGPYSMDRTHSGAEEKWEEEEAAETSGYGLTTTPIAHRPVPLRRKEVEKLGMEEWSWAWKRKGAGERCCFNFCIFFLTIQIYFNWQKAN